MTRTTVLLLVAATAGLASMTLAQTVVEPMLVPNPALGENIIVKPILAVGEGVDGYRLVGVADGMGAFADSPGEFTLLVNHELRADAGKARGHGASGAFVSRWLIRTSDLAVLAGSDNTTSPKQVHTWSAALGDYKVGADAWNRFCSGDLPVESALAFGDLGTTERIYFTGEETRPPYTNDHGRAYAHLVTGTARGEAWELPRLGRIAWENVLLSPHGQRKTIVIGVDDADRRTDPTQTPAPSELYVYVGSKTSTGNAIERAGLTNGDLFGAVVFVEHKQVEEESDQFGLGGSVGNYVGDGRFYLHNFGDVSDSDGVSLQADSIEAGVTRFQRIEDGVWDPRPEHRGEFYFTTTGNYRGAGNADNRNSRLWRLRFDDIEHPEAGGSIEIVLNGSEGQQMLDNVTMDALGRILLQEDVGKNPRLGKIWLYDTQSATLSEVAAHNPKFFLDNGQPEFLTIDEESSGIIDAAHVLGQGWFLLTVQAHYDIGDTELVQGGQILALYVSPELNRAAKTGSGSANTP